MSTVEVKASSAYAGVSWTPSAGTVVSCVQARGSGSFMSNEAGFNSGQQFLIDTSPIPQGSFINSVTIVASVRGVGGSGVGAPYVDGIKLEANAGTYTPGLQSIGPDFADVSGVFPFAILLSDLANSILSIGVDNTGGAVDCEYLALTVDYTPPSGNMYGLTSDLSPTYPAGVLCRINEATGDVFPIGPTSSGATQGIWIDSRGNAYSSTGGFGGVYSLDLTSGDETYVDGAYWFNGVSPVTTALIALDESAGSPPWYLTGQGVLDVFPVQVDCPVPSLGSAPADGSGNCSFIGATITGPGANPVINSLASPDHGATLYAAVYFADGLYSPLIFTIDKATGVGTALTFSTGGVGAGAAVALCFGNGILYGSLGGPTNGEFPYTPPNPIGLQLGIFDPVTGAFIAHVAPLLDGAGNRYGFSSLAFVGPPPVDLSFDAASVTVASPFPSLGPVLPDLSPNLPFSAARITAKGAFRFGSASAIAIGSLPGPGASTRRKRLKLF